MNKLCEALAERAEFEKWYVSHQPHFTVGSPGCEHIAWPAWQARAALAAAESSSAPDIHSEAWFSVVQTIEQLMPPGWAWHNIEGNTGQQRACNAIRWLAARDESPSAPEPLGAWKMVPIEPTSEMLLAACTAWMNRPSQWKKTAADYARDDWSAFLAAAPPVPQAAGPLTDEPRITKRELAFALNYHSDDTRINDADWRIADRYFDVIERSRGVHPSLAASAPAPSAAHAIVNEQAENEGLWFVAQTAPEAYLQQELRRLHAAVEA